MNVALLYHLPLKYAINVFNNILPIRLKKLYHHLPTYRFIQTFKDSRYKLKPQKLQASTTVTK